MFRENFDFPHLDLGFLRHYTCGTHQMKMSEPYEKAHLYENENQFEIQISLDYDQLIRCPLHSRHSGNTRYYICIEFDNNDEDEPFKDHFCQCKKWKTKDSVLPSYGNNTVTHWLCLSYLMDT